MARQLPHTEALKVLPLLFFVLLYTQCRIATQRSSTWFDAMKAFLASTMARQPPLTEVLKTVAIALLCVVS